VALWRSELFLHPQTALSRPLIASSACLLGEAVRYDGSHKYQPNFEQYLAPWLLLEAICPEVGIGLGIPRPTLEGIDSHAGVRIVMSEDHSQDVTDNLVDYAQSYVTQCGPFWPLCGYIFKARSPSCGVDSLVIATNTTGGNTGNNTAFGAFAGHIHRQLPWLLLYEEEDLQSEQTCEDMLFLSYICRDILWQQQAPDNKALIKHYSGLLGALAVDEGDGNELWLAVSAILRRENKKRRDLIAQYRAA
jgi:uncharacterized protein YbbK (DUF523 family)